MVKNKLIQTTIVFVKDTLKQSEGGHDWFHIERVYKNTLRIAQGENVDLLTVSLAALLHDIADAKFHDGDETIGPKLATEFLFKYNVDSMIIEHVAQIIKHISFKGGNQESTFSSPELEVVRDADRLDALGAIGIARTFNYGGFKNRKIYDPDIAPQLDMTPEEYRASAAPTINHFYEKLLLLKDRMHTKTGKKLAAARHDYMLQFLTQFYKEWDGKL